MSSSCDEKMVYDTVTIVNESDCNYIVCLIQSAGELEKHQFGFTSRPTLLKANEEIYFSRDDFEFKDDWYLVVFYPETITDDLNQGNIWDGKIYCDIVKYSYKDLWYGDRRILYKGPGQSEPSYRD